MKKIILSIAAIMLLFTISQSQQDINIQQNNSSQNKTADNNSAIGFGLKGGVNFSNVYDVKGDKFNADAKYGIVAGGFLTIPIGEVLGIQPELLFSQKGFRATGSILGSDYEFTRTTNFIDVPILLAVRPSEFITLLAGPQFSYLMKQKDVFKNNILSGEQEKDFENDNIRKNILCFQGGIDLNVENLVLGLRAGWDIQNNNGDGTSTVPRYKNVWYQATVGIRFN